MTTSTRPSQQRKRDSTKGIVLISTLVTLLLLLGVASLIVSSALLNTKTLRILTAEIKQDQLEAAVFELSKPLVLDAMINYQGKSLISFSSQPFPISFAGRNFEITAQDVDGLVNVHRTHPDIAAAVLPTELSDVLDQMRKNPSPQDELIQRFVNAGGDPNKYRDIEYWITDQSQLRVPVTSRMPPYYRKEDGTQLEADTNPQPKMVLITIKQVR